MSKLIITLIIITGSFSNAFCIWKPVGQLSPTGTNWVKSITASHNGDLYASVWAIGVYKSTNSGANWALSGLPGKRVSYLTVSPNGDIFALSKTVDVSYIHKSTDEGLTWIDVHTESFPLNYAGGGAIVFPSDGSIVASFAVTVGPTIGNVAIFVYKSTNAGNNWFRTQTLFAGFAGGMIITSDNRIFLGTSTAGVLQSTNNGNTFFNLNTFPLIYIKTIINSNDNAIYVSDAFGLNRSSDNGLTFENAGTQNSTAYLRDAISKSENELFIAMDDKKVFHSTDRGDSWIQINEGLPADVSLYSFAFSKGKIFAGTLTAGVFVYDEVTGINSANGITINYKLSQNYPNPFNPNTNLEFACPPARQGISPASLQGGELGFVSLKVYNALGKVVKILVNENKSAGIYKVEFNGSNLPSGIYFYKLETPGFTETKSMILLK